MIKVVTVSHWFTTFSRHSKAYCKQLAQFLVVGFSLCIEQWLWLYLAPKDHANESLDSNISPYLFIPFHTLTYLLTPFTLGPDIPRSHLRKSDQNNSQPPLSAQTSMVMGMGMGMTITMSMITAMICPWEWLSSRSWSWPYGQMAMWPYAPG